MSTCSSDKLNYLNVVLGLIIIKRIKFYVVTLRENVYKKCFILKMYHNSKVIGKYTMNIFRHINNCVSRKNMIHFGTLLFLKVNFILVKLSMFRKLDKIEFLTKITNIKIYSYRTTGHFKFLLNFSLINRI